ncbi:MAG: PfkB family carbohydrate kinase [Daejeonella sp.]
MPSPARRLSADLLKNIYLITPNETEAELLTGVRVHNEHSAREAADQFKSYGAENVIITLGSKGAWVSAAGINQLVEAPIVKAIDTTAAGDIFNGVLASSLLITSDWLSAVKTACQAASLSVTRLGAQASAPYIKEFTNLK